MKKRKVTIKSNRDAMAEVKSDFIIGFAEELERMGIAIELLGETDDDGKERFTVAEIKYQGHVYTKLISSAFNVSMGYSILYLIGCAMLDGLEYQNEKLNELCDG